MRVQRFRFAVSTLDRRVVELFTSL